MEPAIVLFGLIIVSFLPPINLPIIKPPVSENIQINIIQIKNIGDWMYIS